MKIGLIVVIHSIYPTKLFETVKNSIHAINWYIYFHGTDASLECRVREFSKQAGVSYFPYMENRGLSVSWNDGFLASRDDCNEVTLLLNDDLHFIEDGLDRFVDFIVTQDNYDLVFVMGKEIGHSEFSGQTLQQGFACCALGEGAYSKVGLFDQNIRPAYFEDSDYFYRLALAGGDVRLDTRVLVEHERSSTIRVDPVLAAEKHQMLTELSDYYKKKWGGGAGEEVYKVPFNNPTNTLAITADQRLSPYGAGFDR